MKKIIILAIVFLCFVSFGFAEMANYVFETHGITDDSSAGSIAPYTCQEFKVNVTGRYFVNVTKFSACTAPKAYITNYTLTDSLEWLLVPLQTSLFAGDSANFSNLTLVQDVPYTVCVGNDGSGYIDRRKTSGISFPYYGGHFTNFTRDWNYDSATHIWSTTGSIVYGVRGIWTAVESEILVHSQTISGTNWNTPNINLTWNVSSAQNGTVRLYVNGVINQTLFYEPIGYNTTQITNDFLINDNISYGLYLQNGSVTSEENSSTIQIMPPRLSYNNIVNESSIWKQDLLGNYSENASNVSYYNWKINGSVVKTGNATFNISDYLDSYLGKNITFCVNQTVPSQNYSLENCSSNSFIIGQIINFTAYTHYNSTKVSGFNITASANNFSTASDFLFVYAYNKTDEYFFTKSGYVSISVNLTTNITSQQYNFTIYANNIVYSIFLDEITSVAIPNVTFDIISTNYFGRFTSNDTGYTFVSIPAEDYEIRYSISNTSTPSGYEERSYFFRLPLADTSNSNITMRVLNDSYGTIFVRRILTEDSEPLENGILDIQRFYSSSGTWKTVEMASVDSQGNAVFHAVANTQYYRLRILQNFSLVDTQNPAFLIDSTADIKVNLASGLTTFYSNCKSVSAGITNNSLSQYLMLDYIDPSNSLTQMCFRVDRTYGVYYYTNTTCSSDTSGTIITYINISQPGTYKAYAYATLDGDDCLAATYENSFTRLTNGGHTIFGVVGLALFILILLVAARISIKNPTPGIIIVITSLAAFGTQFLGIVILPQLILGGIFVVSIIVLWLYSRDNFGGFGNGF